MFHIYPSDSLTVTHHLVISGLLYWSLCYNYFSNYSWTEEGGGGRRAPLPQHYTWPCPATRERKQLQGLLPQGGNRPRAESQKGRQLLEVRGPSPLWRTSFLKKTVSRDLLPFISFTAWGHLYLTPRFIVQYTVYGELEYVLYIHFF